MNKQSEKIVIFWVTTEKEESKDGDLLLRQFSVWKGLLKGKEFQKESGAPEEYVILEEHCFGLPILQTKKKALIIDNFMIRDLPGKASLKKVKYRKE